MPQPQYCVIYYLLWSFVSLLGYFILGMVSSKMDTYIPSELSKIEYVAVLKKSVLRRNNEWNVMRHEMRLG